MAIDLINITNKISKGILVGYSAVVPRGPVVLYIGHGRWLLFMTVKLWPSEKQNCPRVTKFQGNVLENFCLRTESLNSNPQLDCTNQASLSV